MGSSLSVTSHDVLPPSRRGPNCPDTRNQHTAHILICSQEVLVKKLYFSRMREALVTCKKSAKDLVRKSTKYFFIRNPRIILHAVLGEARATSKSWSEVQTHKI